MLGINCGHNAGIATERVIELLLQLRLRVDVLVGESLAIDVVKGEHVVSCPTQLLDWEDVEAIWERIGTQLLLPLGKVDPIKRRHGVLLLPFGKIIDV